MATRALQPTAGDSFSRCFSRDGPRQVGKAGLRQSDSDLLKGINHPGISWYLVSYFFVGGVGYGGGKKTLTVITFVFFVFKRFVCGI